MKRYAWITDPHLNFIERTAIEDFCDSVTASSPDGILLSGDVGEAPSVTSYLEILETRLRRPIYFVLGNHDFYHGSIASVCKEVAALAKIHPRLVWLSQAGIVELTASTGLIGHDGWADGRLGDYWHSDVFLNDYLLIGDFRELNDRQRLKVLHGLGDEAAAYLRSLLPEALARFPHLIVVTHVPPFREACWYNGQVSNDNWLPHFSCKAVGDVLAAAMRAHPDRDMTVLCGHTHGAGEAQILPNLRVLTGGAEYGRPRVDRILTIAD